MRLRASNFTDITDELERHPDPPTATPTSPGAWPCDAPRALSSRRPSPRSPGAGRRVESSRDTPRRARGGRVSRREERDPPRGPARRRPADRRVGLASSLGARSRRGSRRLGPGAVACPVYHILYTRLSMIDPGAFDRSDRGTYQRSTRGAPTPASDTRHAHDKTYMSHIIKTLSLIHI